MHCPQCGCKMGLAEECPYCKITSEQVYFASNLKAKQYIKNGKAEDVCYSTVRPRDVSKLKIILLTIFLGFLGVSNFYIGRKIKGIFCCLSIIILVVLYALQYSFEANNVSFFVLNLSLEISLVCVAINIVLWIADILALIFKYYKYPVVIPTQEELASLGRRSGYGK